MHPTSAASSLLLGSLTPFLYPCLDSTWVGLRRSAQSARRSRRPPKTPFVFETRCLSIAAAQQTTPEVDPLASKPAVDVGQYDHLDPQLPDYTTQPFADSCALTLHSGAGGHGCISFLREKYIANGPPNGGDGGTGGNVYIQAVRGETSLHKLARRGILKAGRGRNGQGSLQGGARGEDVLITVPVGTVVREAWRRDPVAEEERLEKEERRAKRKQKGFGRDSKEDAHDAEDLPDQTHKWRRDRWLLYPGALPKYFTSADFPALPRARRSNLAASQPPAPLRLDLDQPMDQPMLLAAGAMGGLGNPHFATKSIPKPKFATKGDDGMSVHVQLELKLLADVGLVGLPNAGKSTLLRALTGSRARVGDWAFTTLSPNIGTVVLDNYRGRPSLLTDAPRQRSEPRANFTIADIPGLVEDAHQDRGLGLGFLRHIERAAVLCFVVDLSAGGGGDAVAALQGLWREVGEYERLREREVNADTERTTAQADGVVPFASSGSPVFSGSEALEALERAGGGRDGADHVLKEDVLLEPQTGRPLPELGLPPISSKPWFVVATKADVPGTQDNFLALKGYLDRVQGGEEAHPAGEKNRNAWRRNLQAVPVSALNREGVEGIPELVVRLLDD